MLIKVLAVHNVGPPAAQVPQRDAAEARIVLVPADQVLHLLGPDVAGPGGGGAGGQADEELRVPADVAGGGGVEEVGPGVVVEAVPGQEARDGVAAGVVVELDEEEVNGRAEDEVAEVEVEQVGGALRRGGDELRGV